jgi:hypothetical protein
LLAIFLATPAGAASVPYCNTCDRPDLPDHNASRFSVPVALVSGVFTVSGSSYALLHLNQSGPPHASGGRHMSGSNTIGNKFIEDVIFWEMFEPDKLQRSTDKASLSQKNGVAVGVYHYSLSGGLDFAYTYTASSVEGCSASASSDAKKQQAQWKVQCGVLGDVLTSVGVSSSLVRTFVSLVLDTPLTKKLKLGAKAPF